MKKKAVDIVEGQQIVIGTGRPKGRVTSNEIRRPGVHELKIQTRYDGVAVVYVLANDEFAVG